MKSTPLTSGLRFEFYEQDGNWFVISDQGDLFLNGAAKGKREFDQLQPSSPVLVRSPVFQPDQAILQDLLAPGTSARNVARAMVLATHHPALGAIGAGPRRHSFGELELQHVDEDTNRRVVVEDDEFR